jgi:hypothetical protein
MGHLFKDAGVVADSLMGSHNAMEVPPIVNRICIQKGFEVSPQLRI